MSNVVAVAVMAGFRWRGLLARAFLFALACIPGGPVRAQDAGWLYVVDVPVADQSPTARQQAARDALVVVLSRLTGLARLPDDPRIRSAVATADRYYAQFGYAAGAAPGAIYLRVQFSAPALFELIRSAGLPVWPSARPVVRAVVVVDDGTGPRMAAAMTDQSLLAALEQRALERGLLVHAEGSGPPPAAAPGAQPAVDAGPAAVVAAVGQPASPTPGLWDAAAADLAASASREPGELPLVMRIGATAGGTWAARWELVEEAPSHAAAGAAGRAAPVPGGAAAAGSVGAEPPAPSVFEASAATPDELARTIVDQLVEQLLGRYQVQAGDRRLVTVDVRGLGSARDYAQTLGIFGGVEVIDDVAVVAAEGDRVRFALTTMAAPEQVLAIVTADGRLVVEAPGGSVASGAVQSGSTPAPAGAPAPVLQPTADAVLDLRWQGR